MAEAEFILTALNSNTAFKVSFGVCCPGQVLFYARFSIHHSLFTSGTKSFGEECSGLVQERKDLNIQYFNGEKKPQISVKS